MIVSRKNKVVSNNYNSYYELVNILNLSDKEIKKRYGNKTENWYVDVADKIDLYFNLINSGLKSFKKNIKENINILYENKFDMSQYENVIKPYSEDIESPLKIEHYDLITTRLNVLVGEEILRPELYKVVNLSNKNTKWLKDKKKNLVNQFFQKLIEIPTDEEGNITNPQDLQMIREQIEYMNMDFIAYYEKTFSRILKYLYERDNYKQLENQALYTYLGTGCLIIKTYETNKDIKVRLVNPSMIDLDVRGEVFDVSQSLCYREFRYMNFHELIKEYGEYLDEKDIEYLTTNSLIQPNYSNITRIDFNVDTNNLMGFNRSLDSYKVIEYEFKRVVRAKLLSIYDEENDEMIEEIVPEDFEVDDSLGAVLKDINITEVHQVVRINDEVYCKMGKVKTTLRDLDNYNNVTSSYNGIITKFNLIDRVKPLQALYNLVMYLLKKEMIRAKGKVFVMDVAQIPKTYGWDIEKWLYYLDVFGLIGINSLEKNDLNERPTFNQFQEIDLSLGNTINSYIAQLEAIKREVIEIIGVNQQRIGITRSTETLGGIERSVTQSVAITEPLLEYYRSGFKNVLQSILNLIKYVYPLNKKIEYTNEYGAKEIILMNDIDMFLQNYGIVVTNHAKYKGIIDFMQEHSRYMMQQGALDVQDFLRIMKSNSIEEIEIILKLSEQKRQEMIQQQQEQQMLIEQEKNKLEQQKIEFEQNYKMKLLELEEKKLQLEEKKILLNNRN